MEAPQNTNADSLVAELEKLSTFDEVKDWGQRAKGEIERIASLVRAADVEIAREAHELERVKFASAKKPLVGRLFSGASNEEKEMTERIEEHRQTKAQLALAVQRLQELMDFTPTSPEQQKKLLQELRLRKREVQEKKREITTVMRTTRTTPNPLDAAFDADTIRRRKARYIKDDQVLPQEKMRDASERQIAQLERDIAWAEKFH